MHCTSILSTREDLDRMKYGVGNQTDPWYTAYQNMSSDSLASSSYTMKGPLSYVTRDVSGSSPGKTQLSHDAVASLLNALRYVLLQTVIIIDIFIQLLAGTSRGTKHTLRSRSRSSMLGRAL
jgi:hypothetical protein